MILKLYDSNNKLVSSSVDDKAKVNNKILAFRPDKPGKYYISTFFEKNETSCCLVLFGMIKKNIDQYYNTTHKKLV